MHPDDHSNDEEEFPKPGETGIEEPIPENITGLNSDIPAAETPPITILPFTKQYLSGVKQMIPSGNRYFFSDGISKVEVKVVSDEIIRVRMAPQGEFLDEFSYAVEEKIHHITRIETLETENYYSIATNAVACRIAKKNFQISFVDLNEVIINEDATPMHWEENTLYGGYYVYASKKFREGEHFFGLGDKPMHLNLVGKRLQTWSTDAYSYEFGSDPLYKNVPFYIGIHHNISYGIFFDNTFRSFFDFAHQDKDVVSFWSDGGELQY